MRSSIRAVAGAIRFDVLVTVVLIFVLLAVLIDRLDDAQRASERTVVDMEVATLRAELQLMVASRMTRGEDAQLIGWVGRNPAELAWNDPPGAPAAGGLGFAGKWRWDAAAGALTYVFLGGECLQLRLTRVRPGATDGWSLGGGLLLVPARKEKNC